MMPASGSPPLPVLLVDDDEAFLRSTGDILAMKGFSPRTAASAEGALETAAAMLPRPAVAVVDLRLPDMSGLDLASRFRETLGHIEVVILTGHASVDSAIKALRDETCDYLVKPVHPDDLVKTLRAAEGRWRLRSAQEELDRSRRLLEALVESSPLPLLVLGTDFVVRMWNRAAEEVFGWARHEVVGGPLPWLGDRVTQETRRVVSRALEGDTISGVEVKRRRRDGTMLELRLSVAGLSDPRGEVYAVVEMFEDLTERRRISTLLAQAQRMDAVGRLAGGVAHDFNTLLTVIGSEADLALREPSLSDPVHDALTGIRRTVERGAELTTQLLSFAHSKADATTLVRPNELVRDLERMLKRLLPSRIRLETNLADDAWPVQVDRGRLEQVLTNLVVNARDAMPDGGSISIETVNQVGTTDPFDDADAGEWLVLSVADTGPGIPEELQERVFDPFFTTKEKGEGTGLGLATCFGIVNGFGGRLDLRTSEAGGALFRVRLPRAVDEASADTSHVEAEAEEDSPSGTERILLVEDHAELRTVSRRILRRQGYAVESVGDAHAALTALERAHALPDLAMVDGHLPDGDGRKLMATIRERWPSVRVLLTSGSFDFLGDQTDIPFLPKPYSFEALAQAVRTALDGPPGPRTTRAG